MAPKNQPSEGQISMFAPGVIGNVVSAEALPTTPETAFVDLTERAAYLVAILKTYDELPDQASWLRMAKLPDSRLHHSIYGGSVAKGDNTIKGRQKVHDDAAAGARMLFGRAYSEHAVTDAGLISEEVAKQQADEEYSSFEKAYRGGSDARKAKREQLRIQLARTALLQPSEAVPAPDAVVTQPRPVNLKAKVNLGTMLGLDFQGIEPVRYSEVTTEDMERYNSVFLRKHLLDVRSGSRNAERYQPDNSTALRFVTLSPDAWKIARSIPKLAESASNRSEIKRSNPNFINLDTDAPRRAGVKAIKSRKLAIETYRSNVLESSLQLISKFQEALEFNGNLSRFGNEANARVKLTELQNGAISEMLLTVGIHANMKDDERKRMVLTVDRLTYGSADSARSKRNFGILLGLVKEWQTAEYELLGTLVLQADSYLAKHDINEQ